MANKRWHQFTIGSLLVLTVGCAVVSAWARSSELRPALWLLAYLLGMLAVITGLVVGFVLFVECLFRRPWMAMALLLVLAIAILLALPLMTYTF